LGEEIANPLRRTGVQTIKNFEMANASKQTVKGAPVAASAANDNQRSAWPERPFHCVVGRLQRLRRMEQLAA
jgi:hypothetical protein